MIDKSLNISILYTEDERVARESIAKILSRRVDKLYVAKNGEEALQLFLEHKPDLLLTDIQMPKMDGLKLVDNIKQINPNAKVIMMTAYTETDYMLKSIQLKVDAYIVKPVRKEILLSTITKQAEIILLGKKTKEQEKQLVINENRFNAVFNNNPNPLHLVNRNFEIVLTNSTLLKLKGVKQEDILGKKCYEVYQNNSNICKKCAVKAVFETNNNAKAMHTVELPDGSTSYFDTYAYPIYNDKNEIVYVVEATENVTDRIQAEKKISKQNIELKERNDELNAFSHTVAHDLKSPLGTIMGFAGLLQDATSDISSNDFDKYVDIIVRSGQKTQQIINSLLLFASVRKEEIVTCQIEMEPIVTEALKRFTTIINKTGTEIIIQKDLPTTLGNAAWIEEVWANLISNAIKYSGTPPLIEIGFDNKLANTKTDMIRFWIRDNGAGISDNNQKTIFNKFERLSQVSTDGHGLGLSIVKRIIDKLGGEVGLESSKEGGSLFYFTLQLNTKYETSSLKTETLSKKLKILIVEDEITVDKFLNIIVHSISRLTLHAKNGKEAVDIFRNNPDIDLILMDIKMPIMDGFEASKHIRKLNKDVIIIAQTAYLLSNDRSQAIKAGCNDYITKPINAKELLKMIDDLFQLTIN